VIDTSPARIVHEDEKLAKRVIETRSGIRVVLKSKFVSEDEVESQPESSLESLPGNPSENKSNKSNKSDRQQKGPPPGKKFRVKSASSKNKKARHHDRVIPENDPSLAQVFCQLEKVGVVHNRAICVYKHRFENSV
jgi:hypothetical protein